MLNHGFLIILILHINRDFTAWSYNPWIYNGTTPEIEKILNGRCLEYKLFDPNSRNPSLFVDVDCDIVGGKFKNSFAYKDSCTDKFDESSYDEFFNVVNNKKSLNNQALFWSGIKGFAHDYSHIKDGVYTLEDTFSGYLINDLSWCGCKPKTPDCIDGVNYVRCNKSCNSPSDSFWSRASRTFAENANGTAYVMVNGSTAENITAYYNGSYFGKIELPTLGKMKKVNLLIVLVVFNLDNEPKEKCGKGSLVNLVSDAKKYGLNVQCKDKPSDTLFLLCAKYPQARECVKMSNDAGKLIWSKILFVLITISVIFTMFPDFYEDV
ncbi:ADP-ribosyl cyclase/cyclic ADP-ribose hydrolase isoform X2 [Hydra vulgaris]|uniref:ADP-ribosyl cyclase/cyclic ADP-ribose hydrolase isoform X2 n=1 Tax=Hydra vulgaris TaxID=6087 RepID=A0ABM4D7A4_HYDVU